MGSVLDGKLFSQHWDGLYTGFITELHPQQWGNRVPWAMVVECTKAPRGEESCGRSGKAQALLRLPFPSLRPLMCWFPSRRYFVYKQVYVCFLFLFFYVYRGVLTFIIYSYYFLILCMCVSWVHQVSLELSFPM